MTTLTDNTRRLILTTVVLVLSVLACVMPIPTTPATTVPDNTLIPKSVLSGSPTTPRTTPETSVVTAYQSLHVRAARGVRAIVIGYLYNGNTVTLTDQCDQGWAEIVWEDAPSGTAWVNAKFLSKNKCSEEQ